jgi:hypothetical protein
MSLGVLPEYYSGSFILFQLVLLLLELFYFSMSSYDWCRVWAKFHPLSCKMYAMCTVPWARVWQASELFIFEHCRLPNTSEDVFEFSWTPSWRCLPSISLAASRLWGAHALSSCQVFFRMGCDWTLTPYGVALSLRLTQRIRLRVNLVFSLLSLSSKWFEK